MAADLRANYCSVCGKPIDDLDSSKSIVISYRFKEKAPRYFIPRMTYTHKECYKNQGEDIVDQAWF